MTQVTVGNVVIGNDRPLTVIAGPCQLESETHAQMIAGQMKEACDAVGAQFVFKASYDKANRTSLGGKRGLGIDEGLAVLQSVGKSIGVPVLTDVHTEAQCAIAAEAVDILQIPAFLCRQTDMLLAAGNTGKVVNVKKGQFLAPWDMPNVVAKIAIGLADDMLTTTLLATRAPVVVAPAMDGYMFDNPATQTNMKTLRKRGIHIAGPSIGHLASGLE